MRSCRSDRTLDRALKRIARADRPIPNVNALARHCGVHRKLLIDRFQRYLNQSPKQWLTERAMQRATTLLQDPGASLAAIAKKCGFTYETFITKFRKRFGVTPARYRQHALGSG